MEKGLYWDLLICILKAVQLTVFVVTFMGRACRTEEVYHETSIHAFAETRTISNSDEFKDIFEPVERGRLG